MSISTRAFRGLWLLKKGPQPQGEGFVWASRWRSFLS